MQRRGGLGLVGPARLRTGLTLAAVLLVTAATQVVPQPVAAAVAVGPVVTGLPTVPFDVRIDINRQRVLQLAFSGRPDAARYRMMLAQGRRFLHFDPDANRGRGSWVELIGTIDERTEVVGILVPGSGAFIEDDNFHKYHQRALHLVQEAEGRLAMVVWAGGTFPKGWIQGAFTHYHRRLGKALALFSHELRAEIDRVRGPGSGVRVVVAGHSFGGAVVGSAERFGLSADAVLHIASAGVGEVSDPYDYPVPDRPRYSLTAPGDLISYVQGLPGLPGLGHGPDPDTFRCTLELPTGYLPDDPEAPDEFGEPLGGRAGRPIGGVSSHSEVFIRHSDAWWQIFRVFLGTAPPVPDCPPPSDKGGVDVRLLPLVVPRVVTGSQCRAGDGLRPGDRERLLARFRAGRAANGRAGRDRLTRRPGRPVEQTG